MIEQLPIGFLDSNCYLVYDREGGEGAIVDPGVRNPERLLAEVRHRDLHIAFILNTHGHFDHTLGNGRLGLPEASLGLHPADLPLLEHGGGARQFGLPAVESPQPDLELVDGVRLELGTLTLEVIHTPGHTPGSVCFAVPQDHGLLTGDTLFAGSVGRTDLPGGDPQALTRSLKRLLQLPAETRIYPGHGSASTLRAERRHNPWLQHLRG